MRAPRDPRSAEAVEAFTEIMGRGHVLTSARATAPYTTGDRFGAGEVLAVLRPGSLVDMWRALQVCVDHDLIVITQRSEEHTSELQSRCQRVCPPPLEKKQRQ